ncbi:MAG TPA: DUF2169 domain-containing protein [Polyangiaceae bacterium]|nr:DUF2169 domain-containing protein [Polyangiaceae bacterium]
MDSPRVDNRTDFEVHPQLYLDVDGEVLLVVVKASFVLGPGFQPEFASAEQSRPVRAADEPWGEPTVDSIRYPSDICGNKPGTDVIVVATAHAPNGVAVPTFDCYARVGPVRKALRIFGLRVWESRGAGIGPSRPIQTLDIRYDFAWGGADDSEPDRFVEEPRNPVGRGVAARAERLTDQLAPQIENPDEPIRSASTRPAPAGFGALGRSARPRRDIQGTYDAHWQEWRAPLPPRDRPPEAHQAASPGMVATPPLVGGEECALLNLHPDGPLSFSLPVVRLEVGFTVPGRPNEVFQPALDTVLIDTWAVGPDKPAILELVWRATTRAPRRLGDATVTVREL